MTDKEIIQKWKQGLRHRHDGKFLTNYEALSKVEEVIYRYLKVRREE